MIQPMTINPPLGIWTLLRNSEIKQKKKNSGHVELMHQILPRSSYFP